MLLFNLALVIGAILVGLIAVPVFTRRVAPPAARQVALALAGLGALVGWAALAWLVFGPTQWSQSVAMSDGSDVETVTSGSRSLFEVGLAPITMVALLIVVVAFAAVLLGALVHLRAPVGHGRHLMFIGTVPLVVICLVSWGLTSVVPAVALVVLATMIVFASPTRERTDGSRTSEILER